MASKKIIVGGAAIAAAAGLGIFYLIKRASKPPLEVFPQVDLEKYLGEWYEIARLPAPFEKECYSTKAVYEKNPDGTISVINTCRIKSTQGKIKTAKGKAYISDPESNAKLKVQFFWPFSGNYWILDVGPEYEYALVGEPGRRYLWILSRTPELEKIIIEKLVQKAINRGFNTHHLIFTKHSEINEPEVETT
jgi:apolipoprotein D and lipocalin family protein